MTAKEILMTFLETEVPKVRIISEPINVKEENRPTRDELCTLIEELDYYGDRDQYLRLSPRRAIILGFMAECFIRNNLCVDEHQ